MRFTTNVKEVHRLIGRLTTISYFLPRLVDQIRSMIKLLTKFARFLCDNQCQSRFE